MATPYEKIYNRFAQKITDAINEGAITKADAQLCAKRILNLILKSNFKMTK